MIDAAKIYTFLRAKKNCYRDIGSVLCGTISIHEFDVRRLQGAELPF